MIVQFSKRRTERAPGSHPSSGRSAAIVALVSLLAAACGAERGAQPPSNAGTIPVSTATATLRQVGLAIGASGSIVPRARVSPGSKIMGRVARVTVQVGDTVRPGQLLVELDKADLLAAVEQARAAIAMAEARRDNANAQYERFRALFDRGSVTAKNVEDVTAERRMADAGLDQARAALTAAEVMLGYAEIRAPFAGEVAERKIEPGDMASPGQALLTIDDLSQVKVRLDVPESDVGKLRLGSPLEITVGAIGAEIDAEIVRIVPAADAGSRTFAVEAQIDNGDRRLRGGMFAQARFPLETRERLLVEQAAVVRRGQLDGLFVVDDDGTARLRFVRLGHRHGDSVEILSGLEPGERYVVSHLGELVDGAPVEAR